MLDLILMVTCLLPLAVFGLDNGLATTPPMGWASGTRFRCSTDCDKDPKNCINEQLYKEMANQLVSVGYKNLGYQYISIGDCWSERKRDVKAQIVPDKKRFPSGIKALADYVHSKGLKLGIHVGIGEKTCAGYPGSEGFFDIDVKTFTDWQVDMLKIDGCNAESENMTENSELWYKSFNKTGRPILFTCAWPHHLNNETSELDYDLISRSCNTWRTTAAIEDSWISVLSSLQSYNDFYNYTTGPGRFHDMGMVDIGNFGLSFEQEKAQFMLWSILASPLIMSNDLRDIRKESRELLKNKDIISVSQDVLGRMGQRKSITRDKDIWTREITPLSDDGLHYSYAIVFFSRSTSGGPTQISIKPFQISMNHPNCYTAYDVLSATKTFKICPNDTLSIAVNPSGATMIIAKVYKSAACKIFSLSLTLLLILMGQIMHGLVN